MREVRTCLFLSLSTACQASCFRVSETGGGGGQGAAADWDQPPVGAVCVDWGRAPRDAAVSGHEREQSAGIQ